MDQPAERGGREGGRGWVGGFFPGKQKINVVSRELEYNFHEECFLGITTTII